jgi:uncharacterized protein YbbC (DUF1343 family)
MRQLYSFFFFLLLPVFAMSIAPKVELGVEVFFNEGHIRELKGKRVALVTNHTGVDSKLRSTIDRLKEAAPEVKLVALFAPEHGIRGAQYAFEAVEETHGPLGIPIYSLHGKTRRPTEKMLHGIDVILYDIQDIGCRSYTYTTTLFYVMEEAAKRKIPVIVLDRPNPINGLTVDGPMLEDNWRSFIGYINVPYCHGMTIGELARFFNAHYKVGCALRVIPMRGWKRAMSYADTGLHWIPTSPQIPEADTPLFFASTGILGELGLVNIGVGYTLPFKVIGAPWIHAQKLADQLNAQKLPGVTFLPFFYRPFFGSYKGKDCQGVKIVVTNRLSYRPVAVQYMLIGILKNLYPAQMNAKLAALETSKKDLFCKANGNAQMLSTLIKEKYTAWKLILYQKQEREAFLDVRSKYLLY